MSLYRTFEYFHNLIGSTMSLRGTSTLLENTFEGRQYRKPDKACHVRCLSGGYSFTRFRAPVVAITLDGKSSRSVRRGTNVSHWRHHETTRTLREEKASGSKPDFDQQATINFCVDKRVVKMVAGHKTGGKLGRRFRRLMGNHLWTLLAWSPNTRKRHVKIVVHPHR